jgi:maleylpyruvate isomerase
VKLHGFFRSGASHRVRIALNLKGIDYEYAAVNLRARENHSPGYLVLNPQGLVPALEIDGQVLMQSPAILEYLEECRPEPPLLPADPAGRARVRALAAIVGCDTHPLNNLRVLNELRGRFGAGEVAVKQWCGTWIHAAFDAIEQLLGADTGRGDFCYGAAPTLADCYLIPQVYSARRFDVDLASYPAIVAVDAACAALDAFRKAAPSNQPDAF